MKKSLLFACLTTLPCLLAAQAPPDTVFQHWHAGQKVQPTKTEALLKVTVVDLERLKIPDLAVRVEQIPSGKLWLGTTGKYGEVYFLVPAGKEYRVGAGDEAVIQTIQIPNDSYLRDNLTISHLAKEFTEQTRGDTVFQSVSVSQKPTRERVLVQAKILDLDDKPIEGEVLFFSVEKSRAVYVAVTNTQGRAALMLPKGLRYCFSTEIYPNLKCYDLPNHDMAGQLNITFNTIGTKAYRAREAERARQAAMRDSLYRLDRMQDSLLAIERQAERERLDSLSRLEWKRDSLLAIKHRAEQERERALGDSLRLDEDDYVHQLLFGDSPKSVLKRIERRAARDREAVKANPRYFEKTGQVVQAALYRMRDRWKNKMIVTDLTGSMSPYMDQVILWHALQLVQGENNRYLFFNDGNRTPDEQKVIGKTGGLYYTENALLDSLLEKMRQTAHAGSGGDGPENDVEALLAAVLRLRGMDELVLVADNYSDCRDINLLEKLRVPVHVVLCGTKQGVNEQYLEIAYKTGGSIHTIEQDIEDLARLADGATITIGAYQYKVSRGKFIRVTRM
ncbi:MAG: hypothetical protein ABMA02_09250 [Saprospiraceae bacterium]